GPADPVEDTMVSQAMGQTPPGGAPLHHHCQATFSGLEDEDAVEDDEPESDDPDEEPDDEPEEEPEDEESEDDEDDSDLPEEAEAPAVDLPEPRLSVR
ncbi:hypothetical protein ACFY4C_05915, partial [Actinomadura viridis]|uniref:hypothetical protein n=1 Tax=Actinomadura viridis TaxID=58110 RepID=UPI0036A07D80